MLRGNAADYSSSCSRPWRMRQTCRRALWTFFEMATFGRELGISRPFLGCRWIQVLRCRQPAALRAHMYIRSTFRLSFVCSWPSRPRGVSEQDPLILRSRHAQDFQRASYVRGVPGYSVSFASGRTTGIARDSDDDFRTLSISTMATRCLTPSFV